MKTREFILKHKFLLSTIPLILATIIMLFVLGFASPKHVIDFIDTSASADYSKDILADYDAGKDVTALKNTHKVGEYSHGAVDNFYIWFEPSYYEYGGNYKNTLYAANINKESEEIGLANTAIARYIESNEVEGVKVEFYVATNIASKQHVAELMKPKFTFGTWQIQKETSRQENSNGSTFRTHEKVPRDGLLIYNKYGINPTVWYNQAKENYKNYQDYHNQLVEISYVVIITHNPSVKVLPINHNPDIDSALEQ